MECLLVLLYVQAVNKDFDFVITVIKEIINVKMYCRITNHWLCVIKTCRSNKFRINFLTEIRFVMRTKRPEIICEYLLFS